MNKKAITLAITVLILTSAFFVFDQNITSSASTTNPSKLYIYTGPTSDSPTITLTYVFLWSYKIPRGYQPEPYKTQP